MILSVVDWLSASTVCHTKSIDMKNLQYQT